MRSIFKVFTRLPFTALLWACGTTALLIGCATPYQPAGAAGGFTETQLDRNIFRVSFRGNGFTTPERVEDMTLLRSAQLALQNGYGYFAIVSDSQRIDKTAVSTPMVAHTSLRPHGVTTTVIGGSPLVIEKPSATNTIFCFEQRPIDGFTYDARFLVSSIISKYKMAEVAPPAVQPRPMVASQPRVNARVPLISDAGQAEWTKYLAAPKPKAFAISDQGQFGWSSNANSARNVTSASRQERALARCAAQAVNACVLYAVDDDVVFQAR